MVLIYREAVASRKPLRGWPAASFVWQEVYAITTAMVVVCRWQAGARTLAPWCQGHASRAWYSGRAPAPPSGGQCRQPRCGQSGGPCARRCRRHAARTWPPRLAPVVSMVRKCRPQQARANVGRPCGSVGLSRHVDGYRARRTPRGAGRRGGGQVPAAASGAARAALWPALANVVPDS